MKTYKHNKEVTNSRHWTTNKTMDLNMQSASDVISSLFWFRGDDCDEDDEEQEPIEQFVQDVKDFSSQYGSEVSVSYTAFNIRGPPSNFPDYGDYPQAFVMRTYGTWWDEAPSAPEDYMPQNNLAIPSQDFVEVSFERPVFPQEVAVFETYNPGAVVRIWAWAGNNWLLLWEGQEDGAGDVPRIFSPPIKQIAVPTKMLRLEFNHRNLPYYTELDAVLLKGKEPPTPNTRMKNNFTYTSLFYKKTAPAAQRSELMSRIIASNLHESLGPPVAQRDPIFTGPPLGDFTPLPDETILCVMKYLDIQSLCRCAQVNKHFNRLASDPILYRSVDLRPYWHCVDSQVIWTLSIRCRLLQKMDLSWCGSHDMIYASAVVNFLRDCGSELTHLRLNCCKFVNSTVLRAIVLAAPCLQELCLRSIGGTLDWACLAGLGGLQRLDLYRADVTTAAAAAIVRANPHLTHVNFGSCKKICTMDEVAMALGACCPDLISVDFWKSYSLSALGLRALQSCTKLQELDVGWCLQAGNSGEWLAWLEVRQLRKLFLGALRGISDRDLRVILPRLSMLEQLDLLGVRTITPDICEAILAECNHLRLLDVSFCDQIHESRVTEWRAKYPQVSIKRSFQSTSYVNELPSHLFMAL